MKLRYYKFTTSKFVYEFCRDDLNKLIVSVTNSNGKRYIEPVDNTPAMDIVVWLRLVKKSLINNKKEKEK